MPAYGPFQAHSISPEGPPTGAYAITPANADLPVEIRAFRVGQMAGDVSITDRRGIVTVIPNVQVGETITVFAQRINLTGTTALGITGFI
jgi:hypothetical protein